MKINTQTIKGLNPCAERFDNYLEHYHDFDGSVKDFLELDKITYDDKVWVMVRLMSKEQRTKWAGLCAQSVLHLYEEKYPGDYRPRKAVEAALRGVYDRDTYAYAYAYAAYAAAYAAYAAADVKQGGGEKQRELNLKFMLDVIQEDV